MLNFAVLICFALLFFALHCLCLLVVLLVLCCAGLVACLIAGLLHNDIGCLFDCVLVYFLLLLACLIV